MDTRSAASKQHLTESGGITGDILLQWVYSGDITGDVGYPTSDPGEPHDGWQEQHFEKGSIHGSQLEAVFPGFTSQDEPSTKHSDIAEHWSF
ncbi:hypothetical protein [Corynebacterium caspium]|uniref:hypothetical protein n=1 Tax=Corynebacterium caspium TaxID=234828 RepID=UPI00264A306C|nr:hypothetical protein [Corynebacterium caspium]